MLTIPHKFTKKDALNKGFKASFVCIQQYFFKLKKVFLLFYSSHEVL